MSTTSTTRCAGPTGAGQAGGSAAYSGTWVDEVIQVMGRIQQADLDGLDDVRVEAELQGAQAAVRRLQAWQTRLVDLLSDRAAAAAEAAAARTDADPADAPGAAGGARGQGGGRAGEWARADARRKVARRTGMSPSQAKQMQNNGRRLGSWEQVAAAFESGRIGPDHVKLAIGLLDRLPPDVAHGLEGQVVDAACRQDPVALGRTCRTWLAEHSPDDAVDDLDRQHAARSARVVQRPDGMTYLGVEVAGADGAFVHATLDAFRTRDAAGEHRSPQQRTADAFMDLVRAASGTIGDPDARHGVPVFIFNLPADRLLADQLDRLRTTHGTEAFTGPLPARELARLLGHAHVAAVLSDATGLPVGASRIDRAVPTGLWRALYVRDAGCVRTGCDAPPGWCQVAHLGDWHADGGLLQTDTAGLLCTRHHRAYDRGRLSVTWADHRPTVHPRHAPPDTTGATVVRTRRGGRRQREHATVNTTGPNVTNGPGTPARRPAERQADSDGHAPDPARRPSDLPDQTGPADQRGRAGPADQRGNDPPDPSQAHDQPDLPDKHDQPGLPGIASDTRSVYRARSAQEGPSRPARQAPGAARRAVQDVTFDLQAVGNATST